MSSMASLGALFGLQLPGHFDFTVLFEHIMLMLVPTGIAILVTSLYLQLAARTPRQVLPSILLWAKLACGIALVGIQAANITLCHDTPYLRSSVTVAAATMSLIASICTLAIIFIAHAYSLQTSTFFSIFFSLTVLFDITMARSYFLRDKLGAITALQVCVVVLKAILIILQEVPKRGRYQSEHVRTAVSIVMSAGFWNRSLFIWLNPLLVFGWHSDFTIDTLPNIGDDFASEKLFDLFSPHWDKASKTSKFSLLFAVLRTMRWRFFSVFLPRLCFIGFSIAQPLHLLRTVQAVGQVDLSDDAMYGLISASVLIYFGFAVSRNLFVHWSYRVVTAARGILITAIYDKMMRLSAEDLQASNAVTLMGTDVQGTEKVITLFYEACSSIIQVSAGMWVLYRFIQAATFLMLIPIFATFIGSYFTSKMIVRARRAWNEQTEKRVAGTSNMLAQIRSIKSMGLSGAFKAIIEAQREFEIKTSLRERQVLAGSYSFGAINFTVTPAIVFAGAYFWTRADNPMSVAEIFTTLAVLAVSTSPLIHFCQAVTAWMGAFASIQRIQTFLLKPEMQEPRTPCPGDGAEEAEKTVSSSQRTPFAVELNNVSVRPQAAEFILRNITLRIAWGDLAMMWGPISSGKSTFLRLLLGEEKLSTGTVSVGSRKISYCSQESWIPNCTIQEIIVGYFDFDEARYREVIRACALERDLAELPDGDQTKTGSGGCCLSRGQRQRLSLARSAYAEAEIMVVDDVFSSVDPETAGEIFHALFGQQGMVRRWNCTVIMTTNRLELLNFANQVYRFFKDGRVLQESIESPDASSEEDVSDSDSTDGNAINNHLHGRNSEDAETPLVQAKKETDDAKDLVRGGGADLSLYMYLFSSTRRSIIAMWAFLGATAALFEWLPMIFIRIWFPKYASNAHFFIGYATFSVASVGLNVLVAVLYFNYIFPNTSKAMHRKLLYSVIGATPQYLNETDSGTLLNRFSQDISLITQQTSTTANQMNFLTFTNFVEIGMISAGSPCSVPIMVLLIGVLCVVQVFYLRSSRQLRQLELEASSTLFTQFTELSDGIIHIRSFGWQENCQQALYTSLNRSQKPTYQLYCAQRWLTLCLDINSTFTSLLLVYTALKYRHATSQSAVGLAMLSLIGFSNTLYIYVRVVTAFETSLGATRRVKAFEKTTPQERNVASDSPLPPDWPATGTIVFDGLTATYPANGGGVHTALDNFTFTIQHGEKVGLMGRTGSGKSTTFSSILRMVDYTGNIIIDGRNIATVPVEVLRSRITTLTQDGLRIKASLRFNLYPYEGQPPTDTDMIAVLERLGLWRKAEAAGGLDKEYADMRFSVAEKQLVFLARAILHQSKLDTKIVMVDEATSTMALDVEAEMQRIIDESFTGCTLLMVSHRSESFSTASVVLNLASGRLQKIRRRHVNGRLVETYA